MNNTTLLAHVIDTYLCALGVVWVDDWVNNGQYSTVEEILLRCWLWWLLYCE
jgi:hypothetical protein